VKTIDPKKLTDAISHFVAVALELGMLADLAVRHSTRGVLMWAAYFYFSATRAFLFRRGDDDDHDGGVAQKAEVPS